MPIWDQFGSNQFLGLQPWVWVQLESAEPPGPFPFMGGVDPEVVASLHEVHSVLMSSVETAISDVFARRTTVDDPNVQKRLEDAYAEVVRTRPRLQDHIRCGRNPDGTFLWEFPHDRDKSAVMNYGGLRIFNAVKRQAIPFGFDRPLSPYVGKLLGFLNGTRTVAEIRTIATASGREIERHLNHLVEQLSTHECLTVSDTSSVRTYWLDATRDRDMVHLGHAALMYRQQNQFLWFDPWLMPWFAESPVPSLWNSLLPSPAAVFLTHDHDDHVDPRTLLHLPKDAPIIVPSRKNRQALYFDYLSLMQELGFTNVIELAHGESWKFEGGEVVSVPFYGEDPCDLALPRNCYLIVDRGHNTLVHADSGPTNDGDSAVHNGVMNKLVEKYGSIATVYASQQQLKEIRSYAAHASLSHPGKWLEVGENGFLTNQYLSELIAQANAQLFVSYATGGADWYPDHLSFMFSHRNPARTALLTAHWDPPESLKELLAPLGCHYHHGQALDIVRVHDNGQVQVHASAETLAPPILYQLEHQLPLALTGASR
ncbi:MBL fold metallo-hydrolase [Candidatus Nitronereus thalassa]|uniref:MBL fold metallo-hydrolase n=1 Tax=Candidatus Nitronereus thalassa TaxID=3020898 RepID=A0ABU3K8L6_9BACT|nr:MBL fold metallo-hydrolase [Candidatus Nitronereus thalassa]MDT7042740.1 MBL fold metallo-hydrolase [Candidatus Nitronereus thalassa]